MNPCFWRSSTSEGTLSPTRVDVGPHSPELLCSFSSSSSSSSSVRGDPRCHSGSGSLWTSAMPQWQCQFVEIHDTTVAVSVCGDPRAHDSSVSLWRSTTPQWQCQFVEIHDPTMAVSVYGDPRHHGGSVRLWRSTTPQLQCQYVDVHDTTVAMSVREDPRRHSGRVSSCVAAGDGRSTRGRNTCLPIGSHTLSAANNQVWACQ